MVEVEVEVETGAGSTIDVVTAGRVGGGRETDREVVAGAHADRKRRAPRRTRRDCKDNGSLHNAGFPLVGTPISTLLPVMVPRANSKILRRSAGSLQPHER